mgnify:CR=1 FL=1
MPRWLVNSIASASKKNHDYRERLILDTEIIREKGIEREEDSKRKRVRRRERPTYKERIKV